MYDVLIVGAGVIGASIARELSKYELNTIVIEKESDVGDGASGANSAIIHSGYDPLPNTLKAKFNVLGNKMYDEICKDLDVQFKRIGSITLANDEEELQTLKELLNRAKENNVEAYILDQQELRKAEPNVTNKALAGLLCPTAGIINPFELVVALMENAMDNGVKLKLDEEVTNIERKLDHFIVKTNKEIYTSKYIINASGVYADIVNEFVNEPSFKIQAKKGEYIVLDHFDKTYIKHTLFNVPSKKGKGVLVSPTTHYNYLVGPSSEIVEDAEDVSTDKNTLTDVINKAYNLVDNLRLDKQIRQFAGNRAISNNNDFIIEETSTHFINVSGIQSPGLSSAPAIASYVASMIKDKKEKAKFNPKRRPLLRLNELDFATRQQLVAQNKEFGNIICRCEKISEGEIKDVINRNCGATTIKGVKKRVRPGFGKCQGGFCEPLVMKILCEQLHKDPTEITYGKASSYILLGETKGENDE